MVPSEVRADITRRLAEIEGEAGVAVLYAAESGSRAWGFASTDSDYDVRFVYVHRPEHYLSIDLEQRRDVIERQLPGDLDVSGWDVRKALRLFARSNPPFAEWLGSPVVYADRDGFSDQLRGLLPEFYSPAAALHHYLRMARNNYDAYLRKPTVRLKKYLYALRPVLAGRWIAEGRGPAPTAFGELLALLDRSPVVRAEVNDLLARKMAGEELAEGPRLPAVHSYIEGEMERMDAVAAGMPRPTPSVEPLNELFRRTLADIWKPAAG